MKDAEIRGRLLTIFYQRRHNADGWVPTSEMDLGGIERVDRQLISTVCQHLADANLIEWKPLRGASEGVVVGMARIKALGVDLVEGTVRANVNVVFPNEAQPLIGVEAKATAGNIVSPQIGVAAKGEAGSFVPELQTRDAAAQVAAPRAKLSAAALSTLGKISPPYVPSDENDAATKRSVGHLATASTDQRTTVEMNVSRATISVIPTIYPGEPVTGGIIVQNSITVDTRSTEFTELSDKISELLIELRRSNEIAGDVRDKLAAEITAGMAILRSPKPDPKMIDLLLKRPLAYIGDKAAGATIGALATASLFALGKLTGLY